MSDEIRQQIEERIVEILRPAIDVRAPYAKQMIGALLDLFLSALLRDARQEDGK